MLLSNRGIAFKIELVDIEKMRYLSFIIICIAVTFELSGQNHPKNKDCYQNATTKIIFNSDRSFVLLNKGIDMLPIGGYGDDTLSYGRYSKNSKYYILNSDTLINSDFLQLSVAEQYSTDSLVTIIFDSPYSHYKKSNVFLDSSYFYWLSVTYTDSLGLNFFKQNYCCFNDTFEIINTNNYCVLEFYLRIYPYKYLSLREKPYYPFLRSYYKVNNKYANQLHVKIPSFTPMYIYYERFSNEHLHIIDSNTIGVRQCYILSKGKSKRTHKIRKFLIDTGCMNPKEARRCF